MFRNSQYNIKIFGAVQGVSFRYYTQEQAQKLNITGFVRNEPDDTVYIEAEGDDKALAQLTEWCKKGPSFGKVEKVEVRKGEVKNFKDFKIDY